ncbi:MAG: cellulose synthase/poly-beta-1,6-N-acetylglucosamine synthase-like glycosyltransferase [Bermanella sp.]|jgi:cellulose synthase/poly-beta-1,6-N-acetylglucosamine synthase-like glycosyltransferase
MLLAFIFCLFFVFYVYLIYPFILYIITKNRKNIRPNKSYIGDVSIVMVVCNEAAGVEKKIINLQRLLFNGGQKNIIIVDDGSNDQTVATLRKFPDIIVIESKERKGKANGLNIAMEHVKTELVMLVDCRQTIELDALEHLTSWFSDNNKIGAISGELMFKAEGSNDFSSGMDGYWRYEKFIRKAEASIASVPGVSGALYILRTSLYENLPTDTLLDDVQIPMVAVKKGYKVGFDERAIAWDIPSVSPEKEKLRKIRTLRGNYQLLFRFPQWILPMGHPIWWQFLSHKIARLLAPLFAIASFMIAGLMSYMGSSWAPWYMVIFVAILLSVPLSVWFPVVKKIPLSKLLTSFITLNWFCILALFSYFTVSKSGIWKR